MKCPKCHKEVEKGSLYCPYCLSEIPLFPWWVHLSQGKRLIKRNTLTGALKKNINRKLLNISEGGREKS